MKVRQLNSSDSGYEIICDTFVINEIESFQQLMDLFEHYKTKFQDSSLLITLDDLPQAKYTSIHATLSHGLDDVEGYDLSTVDLEAFEDSQHIGYLSTKSEFFVREGNFKEKTKGVDFTDACRRGLTIEDYEFLQLEKIHENPMNFIDDEVILYVVPVNDAPLAISAMPNGYFTSDLNPFESYAVAKHLNDRYGCRLFGIGASLLGFKLGSILSDEKARLLGEDLAALYNQAQGASAVEWFVKLVSNNEYIFLKYNECLGG